MFGCVVSFAPIATRPIAADVASLGAFFGLVTFGASLKKFQAGDVRPKYLRATSSGVAAAGVWLYTPNYNFDGAAN